MDYNDLIESVGGGIENDAAAQRLWTLAEAFVDKYIGTNVVPAAVRDEAVLEVASELFDRSQTPANAGQLNQDGTVQLRVVRDPMRPAYGILRRWVVPF